jgi:hypothetical protein
MRPPICAFCGKDFRESTAEGGLVQFNLTAAEIESNKQLAQSDIVAHPKGQEWFCGEHIHMARKFSHLNLKSALFNMSSPSFAHQSKINTQFTSVFELYSSIKNHWSKILQLLAPEIAQLNLKATESKTKSFSPMDNCSPPNCPFSLDAQYKVRHEETSITSSYSANYWNENEFSNAHYSFYFKTGKQIIFTLSAQAHTHHKITNITMKTNSYSHIRFEEVCNKFSSIIA